MVIAAKKNHLDTVIVLDDDPTGTQTVHGIPVLTVWTVDFIQKEMENGTPLFFILTNSRSLDVGPAKELALEIGRNIAEAARLCEKRCWVISRSDSTLRGHYPEEVRSLMAGLRYEGTIEFIVPAFFEGGRYTIHDIHYVQKGEKLIPAAETPYAQDKVFGFRSSNLQDWVEEKTKGAIPSSDVVSISIEELRNETKEPLIEKLRRLPSGRTCIVNAAAYADLQTFVLALLASGIQPILRTAASFVAALAALEDKPLLSGGEMATTGSHGGLVVVGSFVPITTAQLQHLIETHPELHQIELDVQQILENDSTEVMAKTSAKEIDRIIADGRTVVLSTSRKLIAHHSKTKNQEIGQKISQLVTAIVHQIQVRPAFLITKGGITSSDVATKSLGIKRAIVQGQIIKGIPVWKLGPETKFPGLSQVIFPGNVGTETSLAAAVKQLKT